MAKKEQKLYKKPNPFVFGIAKIASKFACTFMYNLKVVRNELKGTKGRRVVISNHESQIDFLTTYFIAPSNTHIVISNSFLRTLPIRGLVEACGTIGKNQFRTSITDMKKMKAVLDNEAVLVFYPAGLMAECGISTPIPLATGKTLKWLDADVYVSKISGTYFTNPKWSKVKRKGKTTLDVYKLIDRADLAQMTNEEVAHLVEEHLSFDAYRNNEVNRVEFKNGDNVVGLEKVLYKCPNCGKDYTIHVKDKNILYCTECGFGVKSDKCGLFTKVGDGDVSYRYASDWYKYIEETVYKKIQQNKDYTLTTKADIYKINDKKRRYEKVGSGSVSLDYDNFVIDGEINGEKFDKTIFAGNFPMLPFAPGERFEIQDGDDIFRIVPEDGKIVMEWILTIKCAFKVRNGL